MLAKTTSTNVPFEALTFPAPHPLHDHREIQRLALHLKDAAMRGDCEQIYHQTRQFVHEMKAHIEDEEGREGLYGDIERERPSLAYRLEHLKQQHVQILKLLDLVLGDPEEDSEIVVSLLDECLALVARHHADEEHVIDEAFYQDEGAPG